MYSELPLQSYLNDLASGSSTPGGGSASALSGAMAAALGSMVARLTLGKVGYEEAQAELEVIITQTEEERQRFCELLEEDIAAYGRLSESYKLPRNSDEERASRSRAIQEHLRGAALVPLEVVETTARLSPVFARLAEIGSAGILSDLEIAVTLAGAAAKCAAGMVRINLRFMRDAHLISQLQTRLEAALRQVEECGKQAVERIGSRA